MRHKQTPINGLVQRAAAVKATAKARWTLRAAAALAVLLASAQSRPGYAATITVGTLSDASATGNCSLRDAITTANGTTVPGSGCAATSATNNTIVFAKGLAGTIALGATLPDIESDLTIDGGHGGIAISGQNKVGVMTLDVSGPGGHTVALSNLTFENGNGALLFAGGAIFSLLDTLSVTN
jgi:CSLREA domain-containing protein